MKTLYNRLPILATGLIKYYDGRGNITIGRTLFDHGSEVNLITRKFLGSMNMKALKVPICLGGITGKSCAYGVVKLEFGPWFNKGAEKIMSGTFIVVDELPIVRKTRFSSKIPQFEKLNKADPHFNQDGKLEVLLGIELWASILESEIVKGPDGLIAQKTKFGYAIFGALERSSDLTVVDVFSVMREDLEGGKELSLDALLQRFWEREERDEPIQSEEDKRAEKYYSDTTERMWDGRYIVRLPFIDGNISLGDSRNIALHRFFQLERRFKRDELLRRKYNDFMVEFLELGHMRLATSAEIDAEGYYIPHHAVTKKFRTVFDGSCSTSNGKSLNDVLATGPNLQDLLPYIIWRFRAYRFVLSADIRKMFRQIMVHEDDVIYQKIFYRFSEDEPVRVYVIKTVVYGFKPSPFLANRTMMQLAEDYKEQYPEAARAVKFERYMDDFMSGAETEERVLELYSQLNGIMKEGGMELSKWKTNSAVILEQINDDITLQEEPLELNDEYHSILGLKWLPSSDCFVFKINDTWDMNEPITKRTITRAVAKIYDPTGFLSPIIVVAKSFIQELWKMKVDWDQILKQEFVSRWLRFYNSLMSINELRIPRWIETLPECNVEFHGFADASEMAYGAAIYVRVQKGTEVFCNLMTAKSRIAPIKTLSIPRLELNAAVLLVELMNEVREKCDCKHVPFYLYSDSMVVLSWIANASHSLKVYVGNRVEKIQSMAPTTHWSYIPSEQNPADIVSRGIKAKDLLSSNLWWHGPTTLMLPAIERLQINPEIKKGQIDIIRAELKPMYSARLSVEQFAWINVQGIPLIERINNLDKLLRVTVLVWAFVNKLKRRTDRSKSPVRSITNIDKNQALGYWIRYTQFKHFGKELHALESDREIDKSSCLAKVTLQLDASGTLRLKGRLENANLTYDQKHPIILPNHCNLSRLFMQEAHEQKMHGNVQTMLAFVREKFWIFGDRRLATSVVKRCITCIRYQRSDQEQIMGQLPRERVSSARPFYYCGLDFFGPIEVKRFEGRCKTFERGYGVVFICLTTKMIHIETVSDMTTKKFIWALERLAAIYRVPHTIFSDNAKTFLGAENKLYQFKEQWEQSMLSMLNGADLDSFIMTKGVVWKYITPRAPFQGGLWEAAVKSAKYHIRRVLGDRQFTFEQFQTLFAKIAAVLNSRPLVRLNDNPTELNYLTPSHAFIGESVMQPLTEDLNNVPLNRVNQHKILDKLQQDFWNGWRRDYLGTLQNQYRWRRRVRDLSVGDFVLLKEDNLPPKVWPIARILEVYPGPDGVVRNVLIRTPRNDIKRAVQKLVWLPIADKDEIPIIEPRIAEDAIAVPNG